MIEIISEITKKEYKQICLKIANGNRHIADDLYQDFCLIILEAKEDKIKDVKEKGYFKFYCVSIIRNIYYQRTRKKSNLHIIANECIDIDNFDCVEEEENKIDLSVFINEKERIEKQPKTIHERADSLLIEMYCKLGSILQVSKSSGIPYSTIKHRFKQLALYGKVINN